VRVRTDLSCNPRSRSQARFERIYTTIWAPGGNRSAASPTARVIALLAVGGLIASAWIGGSAASAGDALARKSGTTRLAVVSQDPYTNATGYHRTEVEADSFAFGSTIVSAFMVGQLHAPPGGATNLGWSVSSNAGRTWHDGFLPGTTASASPPGPLHRVADPSVAYDAKHDTWLIVGLGVPLPGSPGMRNRVFVSHSTDGAKTFGEPVIIKAPNASQSFDKTWISCDNSAASPFYGHCYVEWDDEGHELRLHMSTSTDGGLSWKKASVRKDTHVFDGQPLAQPNGTVVMPILACCDTRIEAFVSTDGGRSYSGHGTNYSGPLAIRDVKMSPVQGKLFVLTEPPMISADVDAGGKVYVVWADCRFRHFGPDRPCTQNDIVMSTTSDGRRWSPVVRVPIDARTSSVDHFLPAVAVDRATSGASARIAIVYYFYPKANCKPRTCELSVGFVSSTDGGSTWSARRLAGPFRNTWLAPGENGYRPGDYYSVALMKKRAVPVFMAAAAGACELGRGSCHTWIASATISLSRRGR
jgi:hypothetical protein